MSAAICGKRAFLEEPFPGTPLIKRVRCNSNSWANQNGVSSSGFHPSTFVSSYLSILCDRFPNMDPQEIQNAIDVYGNDLDSAIEYLKNLHLTSNQSTPPSDPNPNPETSSINSQASPTIGNDTPAATANNLLAETHLNSNQESNFDYPPDVTGWIELFIREMMTAGDVDFARIKVAKVMEMFEKFVTERTILNYSKLEKEKGVMKSTIESLMNENQILKRAVAIQHDRQKNHDAEMAELNKLKETLALYHEKIRVLEMNNYALNVHLRTAQGNSSMPNHFNPDIY